MAFHNPFHRRSDSAVIDRDHDGVDARDERAAARYEDGHDRNHNGIDDANESATTRLRTRSVDRDHDGIDDRTEVHPPVTPAVPAPPVTDAPPAPVVRTQHTSLLATFGLVVGTVAVCASLTGVLASWGIAAGVVGLLLGLGGMLGSARRRVNGRGVAMFAVIASIAAIVLGILALTDATSWLDADVNQVDRLRDWLDARTPDVEAF